MGLGDYVRSVRRRWWVLVVLMVVAAGAAVATAPKKPAAATTTGFKANTVLTYTAQSGGGGTTSRPANAALAQAQILLNSKAVYAPVATTAGWQGDPAAMMSSEVTVTPDSKAATLTIEVLDADGTRAAAIADGLAHGLLNGLSTQSLASFNLQLKVDNTNLANINAQLTPLNAQYARDLATTDPKTRGPQFDSQLKTNIEVLTKEVTGLGLTATNLQNKGPDPSGFEILSPAAVIPAAANGLHVPRSNAARAGLVAALALLLGIGLVLLFDRVDGRIRTKAGAEFAFGVPVLAEVPELRRRQRRRAVVLTSTDPTSGVAEAYRMLRTSLLLAPTVPRLRSWSPDDSSLGTPRPASVESERWQPGAQMTFLVTSPGSREGRTTTVANLAASLAEGDGSVVAVDADLRNPTLDHFLQISPSPGLSDAVATGIPLTGVARRSGIDNLLAITSGSPTANPAGTVLAAREALAAVHSVADFAVLDTPALLTSNDACSLLPVADAVVLVCRWGKTSTSAAWRSTELLGRMGARVAGVVIVGSPGAPIAKGRGRRRKLRSAPAFPTPVDVVSNGHYEGSFPGRVAADNGAAREPADAAGTATPARD